MPIFQPQFFATNKRELPWNKDAVIVCDRTMPNRPNTFVRPIKKIEATAFSTNEPILLGGLICTSLADQRERRAPTVRSKQLVEVTIVEISGADIDESDQDDDSLPEITNYSNNNNNLDRSESFFIAPRRNEPATVQNTNNGESRTAMLSGVPPSVPLPMPEEDDSDDNDEEDDEEQNNQNNDNDSDYDLIFEKRISNLKVYLRSKSRTKIILSKPVLIRPGFLYEIRIQQTPYKNFYNAKQLKTMVQPESDITIRFHPDSVHSIKKYGLIVGLEFNRI